MEKTWKDENIGLMRYGRVQSSGSKVIGSGVELNSFISLEINHADEIETFWGKPNFYARKNIARIEITNENWGELMCSVDSIGVPCSIINCNGLTVEQTYETPSLFNSKDLVSQRDLFNEKQLNNYFKEVNSILDSGKNINKKEREQLSELYQAINLIVAQGFSNTKSTLGDSLEFVTNKGMNMIDNTLLKLKNNSQLKIESKLDINDNCDKNIGFITIKRIRGDRKLINNNVKVSSYIEVKINQAEVSLNKQNIETFTPTKNIVTVNLTNYQWGEFLSSMNTEGIECTIVEKNEKEIEQTRVSSDFFSTEKNEKEIEQTRVSSDFFSTENQRINNQIDEYEEKIINYSNKISDLLENKKSLSKKDRQTLKNYERDIKTNTHNNINFIYETMEENTVRQVAKIQSSIKSTHSQLKLDGFMENYKKSLTNN